jgi:hypothetical protein
MAGILFVIIGLASFGAGFVLFYKLWWEKRIDRKEVETLLRQKGIGEKPQTIVRRYYKTQGKNLTEKEVNKLTNDYTRVQKDFFLTMWENIKQREKNNGST